MNGYEIIETADGFVIENPAGEEVRGSFDTRAEAEQWVDEAEPYGAGADPFGRPDPQTNPEFWCE